MKAKNVFSVLAAAVLAMLTVVYSVPLCFASEIDPEETLPEFEDVVTPDFPDDVGYQYGPLPDSAVDDTVLGDVNGDGVINIKDATAIQKHIVKICPIGSEDALLKADVNKDKYITAEDVLLLQKKIVHLV